MMADLDTQTPREPYRMFTRRAAHRLLLRADNSDERLTPLGRELGVVDDARWNLYQSRVQELTTLRDRFDRLFIDGKSLREIARRPEANVDLIASRLDATFERAAIERVMTEAKYDGYITRQQAEIKRQSYADAQRIPQWMNCGEVPGLRAEAADALKRYRPLTMGQAGRLAGVTPADLTLLAVAIKRGRNWHKINS